MTNQKIATMLMSCALTALTGCATTEAATTSTTPPPPPTPTPTVANTAADDGKRMVDAAETAQHCAGEEVTDETRGEDLADCCQTSMKLARELLPKVPAASLPAGVHAAVELYVTDDLDEDRLRALCRELPAADFMPGMVDEEVRASRCTTAN